MNRRYFLRSLPLTVPLAGALPEIIRQDRPAAAPIPDDPDALVCRTKFDIAVNLSLRNKPINEVITEIGKTFLGTPYVANALEQPGDEHLVVNMRGLDCVSFYENALVLARCIKKGKMTFDDYKAELTLIRYRGGVINGYPSRLHYTSDYFFDGVQKGIWKDMTKELGGVRFDKKLNFMSTHPDSYRQLKENESFRKMIVEQEATINARERYYLPQEKVEAVAANIQNGDIIGTTTDVEGIDTSHTGIVIRIDGAPKFMHAPLAGKKVTVSAGTLWEYLAAIKRMTGILIVRPLEPAA